MTAEHKQRPPAEPRLPSLSLDSAWEVGLSALFRYVSVRGSSRVPTAARASGVAVGRWADARREEYWAGRLHPRRVEILENVPGWSWSGAHQRRWHKRLDALRHYASQHQSADVGPGVIFDRLGIGVWVAAQRAAYTAGTLPLRNADLLTELPGWRWAEDNDLWHARLQIARRFAAVHGTIDADSKTGNPEVVRWVARCQEDYRVGNLAPARAAELEKLPGWRWTSRNGRWETGFVRLKAYVAKHGHAKPRQDTVVDGFPLGRWVNEARRQHRLGVLSTMRTESLEQLPDWQWSVRDAAWQRGLRMLQQYGAGNASSTPKGSVMFEGFRLGVWSQTQQFQYRKGKLSQQRIAQLEAVPGWRWNPPASSSTSPSRHRSDPAK